MPRAGRIASAIVACALMAVGCQTNRTMEAGILPVAIASAVTLNLPADPGSAPTMEAAQTLVARHDGRTQALSAILKSGPAGVHILLAVANGPRVMEIDWTDEGIRETRHAFTPDGLSGLNILSDIFITFWPIDDVNDALTGPARIIETPGGREVRLNGEVVISISAASATAHGRTRRTLHNHDRAYTLEIYSEPVRGDLDANAEAREE